MKKEDVIMLVVWVRNSRDSVVRVEVKDIVRCKLGSVLNRLSERGRLVNWEFWDEVNCELWGGKWVWSDKINEWLLIGERLD